MATFNDFEEIKSFFNDTILEKVGCKVTEINEYNLRYNCSGVNFRVSVPSMNTYKTRFPVVIALTAGGKVESNATFINLVIREITMKVSYYYQRDIFGKEELKGKLDYVPYTIY